MSVFTNSYGEASKTREETTLNVICNKTNMWLEYKLLHSCCTGLILESNSSGDRYQGKRFFEL